MSTAATSVPALTPGRLRVVLTVLTLNIFSVNTVAFMLGPLLPPIADEFGTTVAVVGQLAAVTSIPWAVAGFFGGPLSDRWGRRPLLLGGNLLLGLGTIVSGLTTSFATLAAARLLTGLGASPIGVNIGAVTADLVPAERRGSALGWVMTGQSLATVVGVPLVSLVAGFFGWRAAFWLIGGLVLAIVSAEARLIPGRAKAPGAGFGYLDSFRIVLRQRPAVIASAGNLLERAAYGVFTVYLAAFLMDTYHLTLAGVAPILAAVALGMLIGTAAGGRLTDRVDRRTLARGAVIAEGCLLVPLFWWTPHLAVTIGLAFCAAVVSGATRPVFLWLLTNVEPELRGTLMGMTVITNQGGVILGAGLGGLLLGFGGFGWLGLLGASVGILGGFVVSRLQTTEIC